MNNGSSIFMLSGATALVLLLGLPLLFAPLAWARTLGWRVPQDTDLANYFGRSLGAASLSIGVVGYIAARDPWQYRNVFILVILVGVLLTGVHVYGYVKKSQPVFESIEIFFWPIVSLLSWYFYPHK
jgi:hypothetical protein